MSVEIRTAAEILTPERAEEWAARRAQRDDPLLRALWREFVEAGGPVRLEATSRALPGLALETLRVRATALDAAARLRRGGGLPSRRQLSPHGCVWGIQARRRRSSPGHISAFRYRPTLAR